MVKRKQTTQWSKENRQHNSQKKTDNTMVKRKQTTQWSKENRQHNAIVLSVPLLTIVLSVFF
jgi:post-segregation antitoxin (ccd killing protein)